MADVSGLNVPPYTGGSQMVGEMFREPGKYGGWTGQRTYRALVLDGEPSVVGRIRVLIDSTATYARLNKIVKAVHTGDHVRVRKSGGIWEIVGNESYQEPPEVSGSMGSKPPAASTVGGSQGASPIPYNAPSSNVGSTLEYVIIWATNTRAYLQNLSSWTWAMRAHIDELRGRVNDLQSAVNTNASRLNQTRDYAGNAGDLVEPVTEALKNERIVR